MRPVALSIIIGTYNRLSLLQKCLKALDNGVYVKHEIIVIDGGSTDGTLEYLGRLPNIRLICDSGLLGQAQSFNRVANILEGDNVCWLSDDNVVLNGMLDLAVSVLETNSRVGMVALKVKDVTGPYAGAPYLGGIWESGVLNCNQGLLRTSLLRRLGGFSEEFRDYGIDADLTTRVLLAGYEVVYTKQVAIHHYRDYATTNWTSKGEREQRLAKARDLYRRKYPFLIDNNNITSPNPLIFVLRSLSAGFLRIAKVLGDKRGYFTYSMSRDLTNLSSAAFISKSDLLVNLFRPYYLVQRIPKKKLANWN